MRLKKCRWFCCMALLVSSLDGCALPDSSAPAMPAEGNTAKQRPVRVIISFERPTINNSQLLSELAVACHCQPVFIRPYLGEALIYELALPPGQTYGGFEAELMRDAPKLGIKAVEQDSTDKPL